MASEQVIPVAECIRVVSDSTAVDHCSPSGFVATSIQSAWSRANLQRVFSEKHGSPDRWGWSPKLQSRFGYFNPDDHYEAIVERLIHSGTKWLDVGCGRSPFPNNKRLADKLSARCEFLLGVDPSRSANMNPYAHRVIRTPIEGFSSTDRFDVVTLRMVVEHLENPMEVVRNLARLTTSDGRLVVYTVSKSSPGTLLSRWLPFRWHHRIKRLAWDVQEEDTFQAYYRLNTRKDFHRAFERVGFRELLFARLDDCSISGGFKSLRFIELSFRGIIGRIGLPYPESCVIGVYARQGAFGEFQLSSVVDSQEPTTTHSYGDQPC